MRSFVKTATDEFDSQLQTCAFKLPDYKELFGLSDETINGLMADSKFFSFINKSQKIIGAYATNFVEFRDLLRFGKGKQVVTQMTTAPVLDNAPPLVAANIQERFSDFVITLKRHKNYTVAIGKDLGIIAVVPIFDPSLGKPTFTIKLGNGGHPLIKWTKSSFSGIEIWKNTGEGFVLLDKITKPAFTDKSNLPAHGSSALWIYRIIYIYKDERVGAWSDDVSITVMGSL